MTRIGIGYKGSSNLINSGEGDFQVIPSSGYSFYKFEFLAKNETEVTVKINNEVPIMLAHGRFTMDFIDAPIWSFIVIDPDVDFYWCGAH